MRNKIFKAIFMSFLLIMFAGCGYSEEEKQYMKQLEEQGSINALEYIKNKYGFSASVISVDPERDLSGPSIPFDNDFTGNVYVKLRYNDKKFEVHIPGDEISVDGADNYQFDEIVDGTVNYINKKTGLIPYKTSIYYGDYYYQDEHNGLINDLYIDSNIENIINNNGFDILFEYINKDNLEYIKKDNSLMLISKANTTLVNYHSLDSYNNSSTHSYNLLGYSREDNFYNNALNIESVYVLDYNSDKYYDFDLKSFDDMYYYVVNDSQLYNDVEIERTTISDIKNWEIAQNNKQVKFISDAYEVKGNVKNIYIYMPIKKLKKHDYRDIVVGTENNNSYGIDNGNVVGDYYVSKLLFNKSGANDVKKFVFIYYP